MSVAPTLSSRQPTAPAMQPTVENLCNQLAKHRLLEIDVIKNMRQRWRSEAGAKADSVADFRKWLTKTTSLTDFQLEMLDKGFADFLHFGEYNLIERIANGRMAGVYKALHPLGQVVAIKVLPPGKAKHQNLLARFQREARLAVQLDHDNVVRTFQHAQTKDGMHYLVMEFLEGETLEDMVKSRGKFTPREVAAFLTQALQALDHLHELGMVHRDIKPGNFILVPDEGADLQKNIAKSTVKILDIGLGKAIFDEGAPGDDGAELTTEGTLLGTLNYMAPEQARNAANADIRSDLYSLGCVAYEMISGKPPFADSNFMNQMRRHAEEKPRSLVEQVPGTPAVLEAIVFRLMAKDPAMRYSTPGQVIKELKALEAAVAPPPPPAAPKPMKEYMTWLKTQRQKEGEQQVPAPAARTAPAATAPKPATAPRPAAAAAAPTVAVPVAPKTVAAPAVAAPLAATPVASAPVAYAEPISVSQPTPTRSSVDFKRFMTTVRDWAAAGIGGAVVFLIVMIIVLIRLASGG